MQGEADRQRELLDVEAVAGHLLPAGSVFAFLAEHRHRLFPSDMFSDLFPSGRGRPSIPPEVVASVIVLQTLHGYSDREAAEALTFDLRWKAACGYAVDASGFHPSTLTYWRRRLAASQRPQRIFEAVRDVVTATGAVVGKQRRALDSTILDDAVARQDTVTQLIAAVRRVAREVAGAKDLIATHCTRLFQLSGQDYDQSGKPRIAWDDPVARDELVTALVNDALALLDVLDVVAITAEGGKAAEAIALLALVAGQDVEPVEGSDGIDGRWRVAPKTAPDRVISTVDPDARHAHKSRERRQDGFKAHIVVEPDTGLTTAVRATRASGAENSDASVGADLLSEDTTIEDGRRVEVLADSAYGTGEMLHELGQGGHEPIIKPWPLRPAVPDGFTIDDFTFAPDSPSDRGGQGTLTCPAGHTRGLTPSRMVSFKELCQGCPLRALCTTAKDGRQTRIHAHHQLQREHRQRATNPEFQATYRQYRPMVERSIAWLTRGNRRVPYRGVEKNNNWLHHRVAALNLRRLLLMGLSFENGTWALA